MYNISIIFNTKFMWVIESFEFSSFIVILNGNTTNKKNVNDELVHNKAGNIIFA